MTVYVFDAPPVEFAVKDIIAETPSPTFVAVSIVGACGTVYGVKEVDTAALDVLKLLVDVTEKVYCVPLVSPATDIGEDNPVETIDSGLDVTVYKLGNPPPAPGVNAIDAEDVLA